MDLYYVPFACSLASHIVAREAGLDLTLRKVDLRSKALEDGGSLYDISPKGKVPTLRLDDGSVLTENVAILEYLADRNREAGLAPSAGSPERYRLTEWLAFVGTEMHKRIFYPYFDPEADETVRAYAQAAAPKALERVAEHLETREFLVGDRFTAADAYLTWWCILAPRAGIDPETYAPIKDYLGRMRSRPAVESAVAAEKAAS